MLDNSSAHITPAVTSWLAKNPRIHFHSTPSRAWWLNQVEGLFGILAKQFLSSTDCPGKAALRRHIDAYWADRNDYPTPFVWTKLALAIIRIHKRMLARISVAVH